MEPILWSNFRAKNYATTFWLIPQNVSTNQITQNEAANQSAQKEQSVILGGKCTLDDLLGF